MGQNSVISSNKIDMFWASGSLEFRSEHKNEYSQRTGKAQFGDALHFNVVKLVWLLQIFDHFTAGTSGMIYGNPESIVTFPKFACLRSCALSNEFLNSRLNHGYTFAFILGFHGGSHLLILSVISTANFFSLSLAQCAAPSEFLSLLCFLACIPWLFPNFIFDASPIHAFPFQFFSKFAHLHNGICSWLLATHQPAQT